MNILHIFFLAILAISLPGYAIDGSYQKDTSSLAKKRLTGGVMKAPNPIPDSEKGKQVHQASVPSQAEKYIDTYQNCQEVKNSHYKGVFVPLASRKEWNRFTQSPPPWVSFGDCKTEDPDIVEEIIKDKCSNGVIKKKKLSIHFPNPNRGCAWSEDGNGKPRNVHIQGRVEQVRRIEIPDGAHLCSAKFKFNTQKFWYDDLFLMTIDDNVLAASNDWSSALEEEKGFLQYDWEKLIGRPSDMRTTVDYCPHDLDEDGNRLPASESETRCRFPKTDRIGKIDLKLANNMVKKAMANGNKKKHVMKFITIGDNDASDCQHFDIRLKMDVTYVE